jgi:hypothetical protein
MLRGAGSVIDKTMRRPINKYTLGGAGLLTGLGLLDNYMSPNEERVQDLVDYGQANLQ